MNTMDLLELIGETPETYVLDAADTAKKRIPAKRIWLIAAVIAVLAILAGCVAYVLNLQDLVLFERTYEDWETGETEPKAVISLQGPAGSKAYLAAQEWLEWKASYDPERELYSEEARAAFPEEYQPYAVYTQEMKDKLDAICDKYDVELMGQPYYDTDNAYVLEALQIDGVCRKNTAAQVEEHIRYIYRNGSFAANCTITLDEELWPEPLLVDYKCYYKDAFHEVVLSVADFEDYEQWNYTTTDGKELLLALGPEKALIFAQTGDWFFAVTHIDTKAGNILDGEITMSKAALEQIANVFDFKIQPKAPTEEYFMLAAARLKEEEAQRLESQEDINWEQIYKDTYGVASFEERVRFHLENNSKASRMGYALKDLDGDEKPELLIGYDGYIRYIYSEYNSETVGILDWTNTGNAYLAEDGTIVNMTETNTEAAAFCDFIRVENGSPVYDLQLVYNPGFFGHDDSPWQINHGSAKYEPITEEEYLRLQNSKARMQVQMLPLSEYPMQTQVQIPRGRDLLYYMEGATYKELILNYIENYDDEYTAFRFALIDLDQDGQEELYVDVLEYQAIYAMVDGAVQCIFSTEQINICKDGVVELIENLPCGNRVHCYYRYENGVGIMVDYLRYDGQKDPNNPWFRSSDASGLDISLEPITQEKFDACRNAYTPIELELKPLTDFSNT